MKSLQDPTQTTRTAGLTEQTEVNISSWAYRHPDIEPPGKEDRVVSRSSQLRSLH